MAIRPTAVWREGVDEESRLVNSGELEMEWAVAATLFSPELLLRTDEVLDTFEREVNGISEPSDEVVLAVIRNVVLSLNKVHEEFEEDAFATSERDLLCRYIDDVLSESGVDLDALASRQRVQRSEITDRWRTW